MYNIILGAFSTNCLEIFVRVVEPFSKSDTIAVLVEVPMLALFSKFAAKPAHLALLDPICGTPRKAIALVLADISL